MPYYTSSLPLAHSAGPSKVREREGKGKGKVHWSSFAAWLLLAHSAVPSKVGEREGGALIVVARFCRRSGPRWPPILLDLVALFHSSSAADPRLARPVFVVVVVS